MCFVCICNLREIRMTPFISVVWDCQCSTVTIHECVQRKLSISSNKNELALLLDTASLSVPILMDCISLLLLSCKKWNKQNSTSYAFNMNEHIGQTGRVCMSTRVCVSISSIQLICKDVQLSLMLSLAAGSVESQLAFHG